MSLGVYLVTDRRLSEPHGVTEVVRAAVAAGVGVVQLRDKLADVEALVRTLADLDEAIEGRALLLVNDHLEAAIEARRRGVHLDGVHLGQGDAGPLTAREALGGDAVVGLTANTREQVAAAGLLPAGAVDYLGVGVIHPTSTKADHPAALGVAGFAALAAATPLPCVAIGGVTEPDVAPLRRAGAAGVAVVSAICAAPDPAGAARTLVAAWNAP